MIKGIFFTDIDGTLIDHYTYSFEQSIEGVELLKSRGIPLVPVSSKTFDEISILMNDLGLDSPFVFENGSGIAYPEGEGYRADVAGGGIEGLRDIIPVIEENTGEKALPLIDLSAEEISRYTGLSVEKAELALKRRASLPFIFEKRTLLTDSEIGVLGDIIKKQGAILTKGGRFNHLLPAGAGKGEAVKKVVEFYGINPEHLFTAAAGDSMNDIPMLTAVNKGYLVRKHDGSYVENESMFHVTEGTGPAGFTEAVKDYLDYIMV